MDSMRRGEVWWGAFDPSVGSEIQKTRPAVIVSNDEANAALARVNLWRVRERTPAPNERENHAFPAK